MDYMELNKLIVTNKFPTTLVDDLPDKLHVAVLFFKIDLRAGYYQIQMHEPDNYKTAFRSYRGHYEFKVIPFGLTNSPATF